VREPSDPVSAAAAVAARVAECAAEPWRYDYFALLRRLEALAAPAPRWGRAPRPSLEPVRIGQSLSLAFAPAAFSGFEPASATQPPRLRQHFFGYTGPNGPLPLHLTEFVRERAMRHGDRTLLAFLDLFSHRFALHMYRAWSQSRPVVGLDRPGEDHFRARIGALAGIGTRARQQRDAIHDDARLHFSGRLLPGARNAEGVQAVLGAYFSVPVRLQPWVGHWMRPPSDELTRLRHIGADADASRHAAQRLGRGALLGARAWDRQHRVRLHIGPLTLTRYADFLPGSARQPPGSATAPLRDWMLQLTGDELAWDAQLLLRSDQVPATRLGVRAGNAPRLGWLSWLGARPHAQDARGVRIDRQVLRPRPTPATATTNDEETSA